MALVISQVIGGAAQSIAAETVGELKTKLNLSNKVGMVNRVVQGNEFRLTDGDFVTFTDAQKGA